VEAAERASDECWKDDHGSKPNDKMNSREQVNTKYEVGVGHEDFH